MSRLTSLPINNPKSAKDQNTTYGFGFFETINCRPTQEDAIDWETLTAEDLSADRGKTLLSPTQIGHRLWTTYKILDKPYLKGGTTISTTVYDGDDHFITATLADAVSFVAAFDKNGQAIGVVRLNSVIHKPNEDCEKVRLQSFNETIIKNRLGAVLAVSRGIGDNPFKNFGSCSDAQIDINSKSQLLHDMCVASEEVASLRVIVTCDGFTDGAPEQTKEGHENYLFTTLTEIEKPGLMEEDDLAEQLSIAARAYGSTDNQSIAIQTIHKGQAFRITVCDGHGDTNAACYAADHISDVFKAQCALSCESYALQPFSVDKNWAAYSRDNIKFAETSASNAPNFADTSNVSTTNQDNKLIESNHSFTTENDNSPQPVAVQKARRLTRANAMVRVPTTSLFAPPESLDYSAPVPVDSSVLGKRKI